jgi:GT2 family glycosyltransferase
VDLSVIVVSYNVARLLERCLEAIYRSALPGMEVFVVDNASADGSAAMVRSRFPQARLIANRHNAGFGAANNMAIRRASGAYVALVNPDCEVQGSSLAALVRFLEAHPRAAVAGGRLRYGDGGFQHSAFRFPTLGQVFLDVFPLHWRLLESRLNGRFDRSCDEESFEIDHPLGAFFAVRRAAIERVGLFDEGFFMYAEEVDWCRRFKRAGWQVWHCGAALAVHHGGRSTQQRAGPMLVELHRSRLRLYAKHYPRWFRLAARAIVCLGAARTVAAERLAAAERIAARRPRRGLRTLSRREDAHLQVMRLALRGA